MMELNYRRKCLFILILSIRLILVKTLRKKFGNSFEDSDVGMSSAKGSANEYSNSKQEKVRLRRSGDDFLTDLMKFEPKNKMEDIVTATVIDVDEAKVQFMFSVPMVITNMSFDGITLVSVMFAGHIGGLELAGATLGNPWGSVTDTALMVLDRKGVGELIEIATERGRRTRPDLKVGICGEHGGEPNSVAFFAEAGLDYISCSPFRTPIANLFFTSFHIYLNLNAQLSVYIQQLQLSLRFVRILVLTCSIFTTALPEALTITSISVHNHSCLETSCSSEDSMELTHSSYKHRLTRLALDHTLALDYYYFNPTLHILL